MSDDTSRIKERIVETASEIFKLPVDVVENGISPDTVKGWDSVKHVEFMVALEDCFGCMFDVEEIPELISLERIEKVVARHAAGSET